MTIVKAGTCIHYLKIIKLMKSFILFLFVIMFSGHQVFGQMTVTSGHNPVPGDIQKIVNCDTNVSAGNPGANVTWNFTNLQKRDSSNINFVNPSGTPYASSFPASNVASTADNLSYNYLKTSASDLVLLGIGSPTVTAPLTDPQILMQYPFTYLSTFSDNSVAQTTVSGLTVYRKGALTATGDGWGTLNMPFGSFANALRVKINITYKDSVAILGVISTTVQTTYYWFVPGKKFQVLEVTTTSTTSGGNTTNSKSVIYNPSSPPIGIIKISSNVPEKFELGQNYPNPFNPSTKIEFSLPPLEGGKGGDFVKLVVFDILGREIKVLVNDNLSPGTYEAEWNASNMPSGIYYYSLVSGNFSETKKMMLIK
jgi:hypothetical protein